IMHYMSIDQTEYTHCVMALEEQLVEYTNTYGLEDVEILVQPLDYFRQSLNTKVNPKQKAEETLNANASAYDQITDNNRYIYWAFANNDIEEHKLSKNIDEFTWTALRDGIAAAANGDDDEDQIQSLVLQVISLSADNVEQIEHANKVEFLDALRKVADILPLEDTLGAYASSFRASVDTSYMVMIKNDWIEMGGRPNALETMILTNWQEEILKEGLDPLDEQKARARIREVVADQRAASAWRAAGFAVEAAKQVQDMLKETSADIEWVMQAQATEEAFMVCLDAMIDGMKNHRLYFLRYEDSGTVRRNLIRIKSMVEEEGMLNVWLINLAEMLVQYGAEKLIEKGTDAVADAAGFGGLYGFLAKVFIKGGVVLSDYLGNISGQHDAADNIKFMAILSDAVSFGLEDARTAYISKRTTKTAAKYMQLLKLMIDLRAIGESQVALYGKSFETDYTVGNLPLLKAVRKATDAEEAMSWYQWRDIVEDRISALRVKLLRNPKTVEATGRVRPTVTFDYINSQTLQSFDNTFQYSLNKGGSWASCDGGPIAVERPETSTEIWVRKIDRKNTDMTETGMVTVYGAIALNPARIEVLKTEDGYRINGLDPERRYQVTFSEGT
ncbi:MAG: hypothetical protein II335_07135, partial [Firmicutes bacterium]|nr:hypothetical protein [Bacillota bacterium]